MAHAIVIANVKRETREKEWKNRRTIPVLSCFVFYIYIVTVTFFWLLLLLVVNFFFSSTSKSICVSQVKQVAVVACKQQFQCKISIVQVRCVFFFHCFSPLAVWYQTKFLYIFLCRLFRFSFYFVFHFLLWATAYTPFVYHKMLCTVFFSSSVWSFE